MANINPFYFSLWASRRRMGHAKTGYYSEQPFYSPPALGDVMDPPEVITDEDWSIADAIDNCYVEMLTTHPRLALGLEIFEGAYPNAPLSRSERCKDRGVCYNSCRVAAQRCKKRMEHMMYG